MKGGGGSDRFVLMNSLESPRDKEAMLADAVLKPYVLVVRILCVQEM